MPLLNGNCVYGISRKKDGNMKFCGDDNDVVAMANRKAFPEKKGLDFSELVVPESEHKNKVMIFFLSGETSLKKSKQCLLILN